MKTDNNKTTEQRMPDGPAFAKALATWLRIGLLSFGGPAAQIALMHRVIVDEKRWLSEQQFLNALSFCMLLPGPEAMQLATYAGWRLHGWRGGIAAGLSFVLPGALVILVLAMIYTSVGHVPLVEAVFLGIKAAVVIIVVEALSRIAKRTIKSISHWVIAGLSFVGIFFLQLPFPLIILAAGLFGFWFHKGGDEPPADTFGIPKLSPQQYRNTARTVIIWSTLWLLPLMVLVLLLGHANVFTTLYAFFSKLAVVTFGGAYAVLAYMGQDVVVRYGWLEAGQMMDALGLAETTPGPLILVTEFVGYLAADAHAGSTGWPMGLYGAIIALWATFVPCFLWIFTFAPYIEHLNQMPRLQGALNAITAAVVGVILNLTLWFALHVYYAEVHNIDIGVLQLWWPDFSTLDWRPVVITLICGYAVFRHHASIFLILGLSSVLGILIS